jgi:hypothetical protein
MHTALTSSGKFALGLIRWVARLTGSFLLLLFAIFAIGEGIRVDRLTVPESLMMISLTVALFGLLIAWHYEMFGGSLVLAGMAAFYLIALIAANRSPGGLVFPLIPFAGALFVVDGCLRESGGLRRSTRAHAG